MKNIKEFLFILRPYKRKIFIALIFVVLANILGLALPWAIKIVIDEVVIEQDFALLNILAGSLVVVFVFKFYFGFMCEYLVSYVGENVVSDLRNKLCWHMQKLSVQYAENTPKGEMISGVIGDVDSIKDFLFGGVIDVIYSFLNIFFVLVVLFFLDVSLTLICLVFLPVFGVTFLKLTPRLKEEHQMVRRKYAELTTHLNEIFDGMRVAAGFAKEEYEADKFRFKQKEIFNTTLGTHKLGIFLWMSSEFISSLGLVTLVWFGVRAIFSGRISVGTLMAFYSYLGMLFYPVVKMAVVNNYYQEAAASLERINSILAQGPKVKEVRNPLRVRGIKGDVRFEGVSFAYENGREVLSQINLNVKASEVIALVGKSGAGKTTLINLLLRFYDPAKGKIFIDGNNLKELELKAYRLNLAMVFQDDYLFNTAIRENIVYGRPHAKDDEIVKVAKLANAHQFIVKLPQGYDTLVGERGVKLSYGQRQRISIARAILRNPAILILDEATSNVDSENERLIIEKAYNNLVSNRTTFVIAHRFSTITYAHRIVFIEQGRIKEVGTHAELLNKKGSYWKMWTEQSEASYSLQASSLLQS